MSLWEQFLKYVTGTKSPSRERLIGTFIVAVVIFILGFIGQVVLTKIFLERADVFVSFGPLDKDEINYFFPVNIVNSGQKDLTKVDVSLKTCSGSRSTNIVFDKLVKTQNELIKFRDQTTFDLVTKMPCDPNLNFSFTNCNIEVYKLNDTNLYIPPTNCSV